MVQHTEERRISAGTDHPGETQPTTTEGQLLDVWGGVARKVERARQQLTNAFDAVDELMFIHDQSGRILRVNRAYAHHTGLDYRDIIGKPYWQVFPLQDGPLPAPAADLPDQQKHGTDIATADGQHFVCSTYRIQDKSGNFLYTLLVMRDVTAEHQAVTERNVLAQALQQAAVGTALTRAEAGLVVTYANTTLCELIGRSPDQLVGKPLEDLLQPGDGGSKPTLQGPIAGRESWQGEVSLVTAGGQSIPVQLALAAVLDESGLTTGYVATFSDLRMIKQTQQWNQMLREVIEELSAEADLDALGYKAVGAAVCLTGADLGTAVLLDPKSGLLFHHWRSGSETVNGASALERGFRPEEGLTGLVLETACTQSVPDYPNFEHAVPELVQLGAHAVLIAPVQVGNRVVGGLAVVSCQPGYIFSSDHIPVLESIADQLGVAVHRQQLIDHLVESETRFRHVVDTVPDILFTLNPETLGLTLVSPAVTELLGFTPEAMIADPELWGRQLHADDRERVLTALADTLAHGTDLNLEMRFWHRDGETLRWFSGRAVVNRDAAGQAVELVGVVSDITARKHAEETLAAERDFVTTVLDTTAALLVVLAPDGTIVRCNRACLETFGYEAGDVEGRAVWQLFIPDEERQQVQAVFAELVAERVPSFHENEWVARDGTRWLIAWSNTTLDDADGSLRYVIATGVDITAKQAAERSLREANRALRTLSACNEILVRETDEPVLLQKICAAIVDAGEFAAAWVGYTRDESPLTVQLVTQAGLVADTGRGDCTSGTLCQACPARTALQTARPVIDNAIDLQVCARPWRQGDGIQTGGSLVALPLMHHDRPLGVLVIFAREPNAFGRDEVVLLSELADDLVYGIRSLRTERDRTRLLEAQQQSNAQLQQTLVKTIESLAVALEKRDPYTSGHQQRVADLAVAIAQAMHLDAEQVEGIRLGALIHDVGKIYVPSEILNRPGRLTAAEFALIKTHSEVGFEIVQRVEFPWPVAQMIRQHHERLDGSGYPDGLRGDAIILEARVLAVADVVEAMTSHRPYRPGLGIDAALEEISLHRGTRYDPNVVDSCLKVFRDHGFAFAISTPG
jgi:PAS domain S-box-containing protein/putative nucleotidyltransferase with HDIG domain